MEASRTHQHKKAPIDGASYATFCIIQLGPADSGVPRHIGGFDALLGSLGVVNFHGDG